MRCIQKLSATLLCVRIYTSIPRSYHTLLHQPVLLAQAFHTTTYWIIRLPVILDALYNLLLIHVLYVAYISWALPYSASDSTPTSLGLTTPFSTSQYSSHRPSMNVSLWETITTPPLNFWIAASSPSSDSRSCANETGVRRAKKQVKITKYAWKLEEIKTKPLRWETILKCQQ